ncbi:MAG: tetratricopeptide repeat protein [Planctomycetota bacterium]|jgi:tetratricopeptide (TPR) repeat protein
MGRFKKLEFDDEGDFGLDPASRRSAPEEHFENAEREYREGHFDNALRYYSRALEMDKLMVEAWRRQVYALVELEEYAEAVLWADKALEIFPEDAELLAGKAVALCRQGKTAAALVVADKAIHVPEVNPYPWVSRGEVLMAGRFGKHEYCFSKAIAIAGESWHVLMQIGRAFQFHRMYSMAIQYFRRAVQDRGDLVFAMVETARCQMALGLVPQARRTAQAVLGMRPRHVEAQRIATAAEGRPIAASVRGFFLRLFGR